MLFLPKTILLKKKLLLPAVFCLTFASCTKIDVFEKNLAFKNHEWPSSIKPSIEFAITDTTSLYNIFVVIRHSDAYKYNNLWLNVYIQPPGDSVTKRTVELPLADNKKGWLGSGMDDIFEHRIAITDPVQFKKQGTYRFTFEQIMRDDPLEEIYNVGLRIEKVNQ